MSQSKKEYFQSVFPLEHDNVNIEQQKTPSFVDNTTNEEGTQRAFTEEEAQNSFRRWRTGFIGFIGLDSFL